MSALDKWAQEQDDALMRRYNATHEQWSAEELARFEAERKKIQDYAAEHRGHEGEHGWMLLIMLGSLIAFQVAMVAWRARSPRSFDIVTLIGLWIVPPVLFLSGEHALEYMRFYVIWVLFTLGNLYFFRLASARPLHHRTPRIVYSWFYRCYQVFFALGVGGYVFILVEMFGFTAVFFGPQDPAAKTWFEVGMYGLVYGLYFGIMSRDLAKILAARMAASIGYYSKDGLPSKHLRPTICAICGDELTPTTPVIGDETDPLQSGTYQLECRHAFHEGCIRGWCMKRRWCLLCLFNGLIGKKDMCPYCKEKVDTKQFNNNAWDTQTVLYLQLLDFVRYMVVWQPIVLGFAQVMIHLLGLH